MNIIDNKDKLGGLLLLLFSLFYLLHAFNIPLDPTTNEDFFNSRTLPIYLSVASIACALAQIFLPISPEKNSSISATLKSFQWRPALWLLLVMFFYALFFDFLGFLLGSCLFLYLGFIILGERNHKIAVVISLSIVFSMWVVLTQFFGLYMASGELYLMFIGSS